MRILVFGANGMLGREVVRALRSGHDVVTSQADGGDIAADLLEPSAAARVMDAAGPEAVVNCAAYTNVRGAETEADAAYALNRDAVRLMALACDERGVPILHVSTDFVFDGTKGGLYDETDAPNPLNVYGASKLAGERALADAARRYWLVRTQWLYAPHGSNFALTVLRLAAARDEFQVVADELGAPSYAADVAAAIRTVIERAPFGLYHVNNDGECSWYEFARAVLEGQGMDPCGVEPVTARDYADPVRRPARSTLRRGALASLGLDEARHWKAALRDFSAAVLERDGN